MMRLMRPSSTALVDLRPACLHSGVGPVRAALMRSPRFETYKTSHKIIVSSNPVISLIAVPTSVASVDCLLKLLLSTTIKPEPLKIWNFNNKIMHKWLVVVMYIPLFIYAIIFAPTRPFLLTYSFSFKIFKFSTPLFYQQTTLLHE